MATFVLTDAAITINAVDLSDWISEASVSAEVDVQEDTAFGDTWRSKLGGLKDFTLDLNFFQDFANSAVDQTLWSLLGTSVAITIKATSGATSATNPSFSGNVIISEYTPIGGSVGDVAALSVSWPGNGALARATS